jgi:hypothetical protein
MTLEEGVDGLAGGAELGRGTPVLGMGRGRRRAHDAEDAQHGHDRAHSHADVLHHLIPSRVLSLRLNRQHCTVAGLHPERGRVQLVAEPLVRGWRGLDGGRELREARR